MNPSRITPLISLVVPTLNNEAIISGFLERIRKQTYPKKCIEIVISDGGSKDKTLGIAKSYNAKIYHNPDKLTEPGVTLGMQKARGNLIMILAVDNYLDNPKSLSIMAKVFEDDSIFAAFPKHASNRSDTLITKYMNHITDPFNHFVHGNASNGRTFHKIYKIKKHTDLYNVYDFSTNEDKPLIALAQGFTVRKGYTRRPEDAFDDLAPVVRLLLEKKDIAYVHSISL
jgi:glycosyltransferase involved in cell wall biosynthesis